MRTCAYCGRENPEDSTHCQECGTGIAVASPPSPLPIGVYHALFIIAACILVVMVLSLFLRSTSAGEGAPLTLSFEGFTNHSGQKAAAFTLTNRSARTFSLAAAAKTQAGSTRPVWLDPAPFERKRATGAPVAALGINSGGRPYQLIARYQLKPRQGLTFLAAVPNDGSAWRVEVHYFETWTPWQMRRLGWARFFWNRGRMSWLGDLIWKTHLETGVFYGPELRD